MRCEGWLRKPNNWPRLPLCLNDLNQVMAGMPPVPIGPSLPVNCRVSPINFDTGAAARRVLDQQNLI
jgi:hypothetical protein